MKPIASICLPLALLAAGATLAWGLAQGRPAPRQAATAPLAPWVDVVEAEPRELQLRVRTHGNVAPATEIDLAAETAGRVRAVSPALTPGAFFDAGELLVELDPHDAEVALERAEAVFARRRSEAALAAGRLARLRALAESQVASPSAVDEAAHGVASARALVREARAERAMAQRELARTEIRAPFAGRVRAKHVDVGQFVARATPLARVYATDYAEIRLPVPVAELAFLDLPDGRAAGPGPRVLLRAELGDRVAEWSARIVRTEGAIAADSRMLHAVARVEDPYARQPGAEAEALTVGLFVEAEILGRRFEGVVALPRTALHGRDEVRVIDAGGRLRARRVELLRVEGERVLVRRSLAAGERVSISSALLTPGSRVRARVVETVPLIAGLGP